MFFIGFYDWLDTSPLQTVTMENGAKFKTGHPMAAGYSFFSECKNLTTVYLPDDLTEIPFSCFYGCTKLNNIKIPNSVTKIGSYAFCGCYGLTEITIPENVMIIESNAFRACRDLSITIENPHCEIYDDPLTIGYAQDDNNGTFHHYLNGTIYGHEGSTAEAYAKKYGYRFAVIGSEPTETTIAPTEPDPVQTPPLAPAGSYYGDVDGDGQITAADAQGVLLYAVEAMTGNQPSWKEITGSANAPS